MVFPAPLSRADLAKAAGARRRSAGFTGPELLTVLAIVAIMAALAAPSFVTLIAGQRARAVASELNVALTIARSEAIKRNADVWLCPKTAGASGWEDGWQLQTTDCSSLASGPIRDHNVEADATISGPASVVYEGTGRVDGDAAPAFTITATLGSAASTRHVCADLSGRPLVSEGSCS